MSPVDEGSQTYCRDVEAYLCRKNDGHLVRIVGPAFEQVCGWAARGVPLRVVFRGIDRYFERYYAKGPRRRPVRVEFCEADVLDVFDEWRRAVGVRARSEEGGEDHDSTPAAAPRTSLTAHLDRVIARLTVVRSGEDRSLDDVIDEIVRDLDGVRSMAKGIRGVRRDALIERLRVLDRRLVDAARHRCEPQALQRLQAEAAAQLAPFQPRMSPDVYTQAHQSCIDRLLREQSRLPTVAFD